MTRRVTIKFDDGTDAVYEGVPDNVTPDEVEARANSEYNKKVAEISGEIEGAAQAETRRGGEPMAASQQIPAGVAAAQGAKADRALFLGAGVNAQIGRGAMRAIGSLGRGMGQLAAYPVDALAGTDYASQIGANEKEAEEAYQAQTEGSIAAGTGRAATNIVSLAAPGTWVDKGVKGLSLADKVSRIVSSPLAGRVADLAARGAAQGSLAALVTPDTSGEGSQGKGEQVLEGAALGAVLNPAISGAVGAVKAIPKAIANAGTYFDNAMIKRQAAAAGDALEQGLKVEAEVGAPLGVAGLNLTPLSAAKESAAMARPGAKHLFTEGVRNQAKALEAYIGKTLDEIGASKGGVESAMNSVSAAINKQVSSINAAMSKYGAEVYEPLYKEKIHIEPRNLRAAAEDIVAKYDGDYSASGTAAKALANKILAGLTPATDRPATVMAAGKGMFGDPVIQPVEQTIRQEGKESIRKILNLRRTASDATKGKFGIYEGVADKAVQKYIGSRLLNAIDQDIDGGQIEGSLLSRIKQANAGYEELVRQKQKIQKGALSRLINADLIDTVDDLSEKVIAPENLLEYITKAPPTKQKAIALALGKYDPEARGAVARGILAKAKAAATNKDGKVNFKAFFEDIDKNKSARLWLGDETRRKIAVAEDYFKRSRAEYGEHGLEVAGAGALQARKPWLGTMTAFWDELMARPVAAGRGKAGSQFYPRQKLFDATKPPAQNEAQNAFIRYLAQKQGEE